MSDKIKTFKTKKGYDGYVINKVNTHYRQGHGFISIAYDKGNQLTIVGEPYFVNNGKALFSGNRLSCTLSFKNGFNLYSKTQDNGVKNISPSSNGLIDRAIHGSNSSFGTTLKPNKTTIRRANKVLQKYIDNNNYSKKLNKDNSPSYNIRCLCYPSLFHLSPNKELKISSAYSIYLKNDNFKEAVYQCFKSRGRKLFKLICENIESQNDLGILSVGALTRNILPLDYLYPVLEEFLEYTGTDSRGAQFSCNEFNKTSVALVRNLIKDYSKEKAYKLLKEGLTPYCSGSITLFNHDTLLDTAVIHNTYPNIALPRDIKSLDDLHSYLTKEAHKTKRPVKELKFPKRFHEIDGKEIYNTFKIVVPKTSKDLSEWGSIMGNCIGGYGQRAGGENCVLLAILTKYDKMLYNIMICNNVITQFYGKYNSHVPDKDYKLISDYLINLKNIKERPTIDPKYLYSYL